MERFTANYKRFFDSVKSIVSKDFWNKHNPSLSKDGEKQLDLFVKNWYPHMTEMSSGNLEYFNEKKVNPFVFENLKFLELMDKLNNKNKNVIIEYIHSLYALSISNKYTKETFKNDLEIKKSIDNFAELVSNMVTWRRDKKDNETPKPENPLNESFLENSSIAKIAKEISDEIDPKEIMGGDLKNMDNPMQIFQSLLSGDKEKGIGKLMTTVCDKLKKKMESGDVKQEKLLEEATGLLGKLGGLGGNSSPNLGNMMKMMQNLSSMGDLFKGPNKQSSRKMKRRLKKKLRRKKN